MKEKKVGKKIVANDKTHYYKQKLDRQGKILALITRWNAVG